MMPPCKNCKDRKLKCHSTCEKYNNWREANERVKRARYEEMEINSFLSRQCERRHKYPNRIKGK